MDKSSVLGERRITALLWEFSVPAIIGMIVSALYNVVDSIFVGRGVGEIALTAVTIVFPLMLVMMGIGMLVGLGSAAIVSIRLGERDKDGAELILGNAFSLLVILSLTSSAVGIVYLEPLLRALGASPEVLPYAKDFATIILAGSIFMHLSYGLNGVIRAQADPRTALGTMLIAAFLNMLINPFFIFVLKLGIQGSAYATVLSQAVASVWVLTYFARGAGTLRLRRSCLGLRPDIVRTIAKIGLAPFLLQIGASVVMVIFNFSLLKYGGTLAVASFGVVNRVLFLILMPVVGISQGAQPIIGYNYGAGNYQRVIDTVKKASLAATGVCVLGFVAVQALDEHIIRLFNSNSELVDIGSAGLRIFLATLPIIGVQIIGASYFQAVGKPKQAILFNLLRQIILLVPMVYFLPLFFGLNGIWFAGPVSDFGSVTLTAIFIIREMRNLASLNKWAS